MFINNDLCDEIRVYACDCHLCEEKYSDTHKFFEAVVYKCHEGSMHILDELGDVTITLTDSSTWPHVRYHHIEKGLLLKFLDRYNWGYKGNIEEIRNLP